MINYITNLDVAQHSGGWSGMNHNIYHQLKQHFEVHLVQKIDPPYSLKDKYLSKAFKMLGLRRTFPAFTANRLNRIAKAVSRNVDRNAKLNFYHGATPWLLTENEVPYAMYLDCCFSSYIRVYHKQHNFSQRQLNWLFECEAKFLTKARWVFFSSAWALNDAIKSYHIEGRNCIIAGLGGGLSATTSKNEGFELYFLFIGLDFYGKGGDKVVEAFSKVQKQHPSFKLKIVGEKPPARFLAVENVEYAGKFDKTRTADLRKLNEIFEKAYCFVLPTRKDMTPLVVVEAASVGCPSIVTHSFGLPEMVKHRETGMLIESDKPLQEQLIGAMDEMIRNPELRQKLSTQGKIHAAENFTWARTGRIIKDKLVESLS